MIADGHRPDRDADQPKSIWERIAEIANERPAGESRVYDPHGVLRVIDVLLDEDIDEQRRAWEWMRAALDEDRVEGSKLFPER